MEFKDHFSKQADIYAKYRPHYPDELFAWLATLTSAHDLAWDCGTGNGQAAIGLAAHFARVVATDPSEQQIGKCTPHDRVTYLVEKAEHTSVATGTADIVTAANALHWFDLNTFFAEARRALKPGGVVAAWAYGNPIVNPEVDALVLRFHDDVLGDYWLPESRLVEAKYSTVKFPFPLMEPPLFVSEKRMDLNDFIIYLNTWSATQRFKDANGYDPTDELKTELINVWPDAATVKRVTWKLTLKVGRM